MCLAAVYAQRDTADAAKELVLDKVQFIDVEGEELTCTNLFGKTVALHGSIKRVDLANSMVILSVSE